MKTRLDDASTAVPFPVLLGVELKGVDQLGVQKDLSKTSADIVAEEGVVRYAYVGEHLADRPSIPVLLAAAGQFKPVAGSEAEPATFEGKPVGDREPETVPGEEPAAE